MLVPQDEDPSGLVFQREPAIAPSRFGPVAFPPALAHSRLVMSPRLLPVLIAVAAISIVVLLPRLQVRSRRLFLLRVLFPSWRFFENIGVNSLLQVRSRASEGRWTEWQNALAHPRRGWGAVFHNPYGNLIFARQSAVEHLVSEAELQSEKLSDSVAYAVVTKIAEESVQMRWNSDSAAPSAPISEFQFKIVQRDAASGESEDFLVSSVHAFHSVPMRASE